MTRLFFECEVPDEPPRSAEDMCMFVRAGIPLPDDVRITFRIMGPKHVRGEWVMVATDGFMHGPHFVCDYIVDEDGERWYMLEGFSGDGPDYRTAEKDLLAPYEAALRLQRSGR